MGLFLDGGLLAGILFLKIFLCRNFFSGIVTPPPVISNGLPLIKALQAFFKIIFPLPYQPENETNLTLNIRGKVSLGIATTNKT